MAKTRGPFCLKRTIILHRWIAMQGTTKGINIPMTPPNDTSLPVNCVPSSATRLAALDALWDCVTYFMNSPRVALACLSELTQVTGASDGAYGLAMSMYFLAYAPAQLLVGRLLDRHGVRAIAAPASLLVAVGCLLFVTTTDLAVMGLGRFLQGLGSSVAYLGVIYYP